MRPPPPDEEYYLMVFFGFLVVGYTSWGRWPRGQDLNSQTEQTFRVMKKEESGRFAWESS
jgi:hypothetical protein